MNVTFIKAQFLATTKGLLPQYKYSMLRGALGHALRRTICIKRQTTCDTCSLIASCPYTMTFDNQYTGKEFLPLICYSPSQQTTFSQGDQLAVDITLIGSQASRFTSYVFLALEQMGQNGFGVQRTPFTLQDPAKPHQETINYTPLSPGRYRLTLQSPLRSKTGSKLSRDINLEKILSLAQKRLRIAYQLEEMPLPAEFPQNFSVQENSCDLSWLDLQRYSNRQSTKMALGGFVGAIEYTDYTGSVATLMREASKIHIGKQTTFGYGKIQQEAL